MARRTNIGRMVQHLLDIAKHRSPVLSHHHQALVLSRAHVTFRTKYVSVHTHIHDDNEGHCSVQRELARPEVPDQAYPENSAGFREYQGIGIGVY
jgi:hypothetical protein